MKTAGEFKDFEIEVRTTSNPFLGVLPGGFKPQLEQRLSNTKHMIIESLGKEKYSDKSIYNFNDSVELSEDIQSLIKINILNWIENVAPILAKKLGFLAKAANQ